MGASGSPIPRRPLTSASPTLQTWWRTRPNLPSATPGQEQTYSARYLTTSSFSGARAMDKTQEPVTIKKYANRRLYNTGTSTYVTLEDLAAMVKKGEDFVVYDAKTGEDITRSVLAQIIFEQEN